MLQRPCSGGIFTTHHFPPSVAYLPLHLRHGLELTWHRCWDGKNLDSVDHKSHMYNTVTSEGFTNAPACPVSHSVRVPQVTFKTVWDTSQFNSMWPAGDPSPFVWSFEGTGYGTHADYMFGWKGDSLQRAMDKSECFYDGCGSIEKQPMATANQCGVENMVGEETDGCMFQDNLVPTREMLTCSRAHVDAGLGKYGQVGLGSKRIVMISPLYLQLRH